MATAPSAEDAARYIISVYIAHNLRAGHALRTPKIRDGILSEGRGLG
jgi:hypothetical protein